MARHGENIYKRKDGRYEGRYVIGKNEKGKTRFGYVYGRQYTQTREMLLKKKAELLNNVCDDGKCVKYTIERWMNFWFENEILCKVKASSYQTYKNLFNKHIKPYIGYKFISAITPKELHDYICMLENDGFAYNTIRSTFRLLAGAMNYAVEEGLLRTNPCRKVHIKRPVEEEQRALTVSEQNSLIKAAACIEDIPAVVSLYTGMRLGEICALKWSDINLEKRTISVNRTVQRVLIEGNNETDQKTTLMVGTPKTACSRRVIPMPGFVLNTFKKLSEKGKNEGYVFGSVEKPADPRTVQRRFQRMTEKLGLKGVHFHSLRHSFATRLFEYGADIKTVSMLLGHSSTQTTLNFYAHSMLQQQRMVMDLFDTFK